MRSVTSGGHTEAHFAWIGAGAKLLRVNDAEIGAVSYGVAIQMVKATRARPRTLGFTPVEQAAPKLAPGRKQGFRR